jgi:hypothetical protein
MTESAENVRAATASHSHLFPGAVIRIAPAGSEAGVGFAPLGLTVVFSDGASSHAELVLGPDTADAQGEAALIVSEYTTAAGTSIPQKMWIIAERSFRHGALNLRIGRGLPLE